MKTLRVMCAISCFFAFGAAAGPASAKSKPNLKIASLSPATGSYVAGVKILNTATVANNGKATAGASRTTFQLSLDRKKSKDDITLSGDQKVAKLKKARSSRAATSVVIPASAAAGSYFVVACADGRGAVKESSESDNCSFSKAPIVVTAFQASVNSPTPPPVPDADGDGVPDATDCRPDDAKLPPIGHKTATACASAIRDIAEFGPDGAAVAVEYALVTAKGQANHIFIQVDDIAFGGDAEYSGVEVDAGSAAADLAVGDHVNVIGVVSSPSSGRLITADAVTLVGTPSAVVFKTVTAGQFAASPHKYDAVPIKIVGTGISDITDGVWTMNSGFTVGPGLVGSLPGNAIVGDIADVAGIGDYDGAEAVLLPRSGADVTIPVRMVSFTAFGGCVSTGSSGPAATLSLNHAAPTDTYVQVDSNDGASLTVVGGGVTVLAGNTSAVVLVNGVNPGSFTLTAQLAGVQLQADATVCPID